jgi:hypothetical protein
MKKMKIQITDEAYRMLRELIADIDAGEKKDRRDNESATIAALIRRAFNERPGAKEK